MARKILCTGLSLPAHLSTEILVHCPLIEEKPLHPKMPSMEGITHLIFTSKTAVPLFCNLTKTPPLLPVLSVGRFTTAFLEKMGFSSIQTASTESAEGVVELIEKCPAAHFLWPRSNLARDVIERYLHKHPYHQLTCLDLYTICTKKQDNLPDWRLFDAVYFSSPSTIDAFLELYQTLPPSTRCLTVGRITKNYLDANKSVGRKEE